MSDAPPAQRARRGLAGGLLAAAGLLASKLKLVLLFGLKLGKFATTGWTMLLAAWVYSSMYGWRFAGGLVLLTLVHELGHGLGARSMGMSVGAPVFIPFFGAFVALERQPRSSWENFVISMGGPVIGAGAATLCLLAGGLAGGWAGDLLRVLGYYGLWINLFNLMPFGFLDGAHAMTPIPWRAGVVATALAGFVLVVAAGETGHLNPVPLLALAGVAWQLWRKYRHDHTPDATPAQQHVALAVYFGTVIALTIAVQVLGTQLPATR